MASPGRPDLDGAGFLVERYLSPSHLDGLAESIARVVALCADGSGVRYLHSAYLPTEDTCFCLFLAPSSDAVRAVNREANFALDRITNAVVLFGAELTT
jgi:Protein of unknown function (DUF4242)